MLPGVVWVCLQPRSYVHLHLLSVCGMEKNYCDTQRSGGEGEEKGLEGLKKLLGLVDGGLRLPCLCVVFPDIPTALVPLPWRNPTTGCGVGAVHLRSLPQASPSASAVAIALLKMALIDARSISKKYFLLSVFFTSKNLDFMLLMDTWQRSMEYCHLIELCPVDCSFISTPRLVGCGGGLAVVFKKHLTVCVSR